MYVVCHFNILIQILLSSKTHLKLAFGFFIWLSGCVVELLISCFSVSYFIKRKDIWLHPPPTTYLKHSIRPFRRTVCQGVTQDTCVLRLIGCLRLKAELLCFITLTEKKKTWRLECSYWLGFINLTTRKDNS